MTTQRRLNLLIAEDDPDDRLLTHDALREGRWSHGVHFVEDGEELLDFLRRQGRFDSENAPRPAIIILDLNMPKMDGREVLMELKTDPEFRRIPVIVLTTSRAREDVVRSYELGVNSFIVKPVTFQGLVDVMSTVGKYWFETVELPEVWYG